jgi:hypothetical protein
VKQANLDRVVEELAEKLGENLFSCCLYGSAVRGNLLEGVSDLNLLIVLKVSNSEAHEQIAAVIGNLKGVDPFILGHTGFERSVRAFAAKFASIRRNYRVLHGADPLAGIEISAVLERFLCEQALRNLRLRMVYAYVTRVRDKSYGRFLIKSTTPIFLRISEVLRLEGMDVPTAFAERLPIFEKQFGFDPAVLGELLDAKLNRQTIAESEAEHWHQRLFPVVNTVVRWIEDRWTDSALG